MVHRRFSDELIEALFLFCALYLPGYLMQSGTFSYAMLFDLQYNAAYLTSIIPQIGLFLYLIIRRGNTAEYGLRRLRPFDIAIGAVVITLLLAVGLVSTLAPSSAMPEETVTPGAVQYIMTALSSVATGYREELFFRSMLYRALVQQGFDKRSAMMISALLFAAGHVYQGAWALLATAVMALILQAAFLYGKNIHTVAIAHGLYNFLILIGRALTGHGGRG